MIVSQTETVAVLSGYFHFGNNNDLISFLLELFGFSELLTISKMEIVVQLLQNLQQLRINREFRFFYSTFEWTCRNFRQVAAQT